MTFPLLKNKYYIWYLGSQCVNFSEPLKFWILKLSNPWGLVGRQCLLGASHPIQKVVCWDLSSVVFWCCMFCTLTRPYNLHRYVFKYHHLWVDMRGVEGWLIDWIEFYTVSTIFLPYNGEGWRVTQPLITLNSSLNCNTVVWFITVISNWEIWIVM